jgi:hypothetical protein
MGMFDNIFCKAQLPLNDILKGLDIAWDEIDFPDVLLLEEADSYYLGGHEYELSQTEYDDLVAAGYGYLIETV